VKRGGEYRYYPWIYERKKMEIHQLAERISNFSSLSRGDIYAVLIALTDELPNLLLDNYSVQLGEFGTFSLHASGLPSDIPRQVNAKKIKGVKVAFRPGKRIKKKIKGAKFTMQKVW